MSECGCPVPDCQHHRGLAPIEPQHRHVAGGLCPACPEYPQMEEPQKAEASACACLMYWDTHHPYCPVDGDPEVFKDIEQLKAERDAAIREAAELREKLKRYEGEAK